MEEYGWNARYTFHNYMGVDLDVVWRTIGALPQLRKDLNQILTEMKG